MNGRWGRGCWGHWLELGLSLRGLQGSTDHFIKVEGEGSFVLMFSTTSAAIISFIS